MSQPLPGREQMGSGIGAHGMGGMAQQSGMGGQQSQQPGMGQPGMARQLQSVAIQDVTQTDVVTAEPDTPLPTVAAMMAEEDVGSVVVEERGEPMGVVTDRTIALMLQETEEIAELKAEDVMSDGIITGTTESTVFDALEQLGEANIRRLPLVDEDGTLDGIVTLDDLLVFLGTEIQMASDLIQAQTSGR